MLDTSHITPKSSQSQLHNFINQLNKLQSFIFKEMNVENIINSLRTTAETICPTVRYTRILNPTELYNLLCRSSDPAFWSNFQYVTKTRNIHPIDISRALSKSVNYILSLKQAQPDILYISTVGSQEVLFFFSLVPVPITTTVSNDDDTNNLPVLPTSLRQTTTTHTKHKLHSNPSRR